MSALERGKVRMIVGMKEINHQMKKAMMRKSR